MFTTTLTSSMMMMIMFWINTAKMSKMMIQWHMMMTDTVKMTMMMIIDTKSMAFMSCVMLISAAVILYSKNYMSGEKKKTRSPKLS